MADNFALIGARVILQSLISSKSGLYFPGYMCVKDVHYLLQALDFVSYYSKTNGLMYNH